MNITKKEFNILVSIEKEKKINIKLIKKENNYPEEEIKEIINNLEKKQLIKDKNITDKGLEVLEPYRVKRAIFLAAGFGSRMVPITLTTPKPLVKVNGKRIIETLLEAVKKAEIKQIIIVRGYLKEEFNILKLKYPKIKFVDNNMYKQYNNISSAYLIKDYLTNSYVLESDLVLSNQNLIRKYEYESNFLGIPVKESNDWCVTVENNIIKEEKIGGENCHQLVGISYYNREDGKKLAKDIEEVFNTLEGKELYWEQVPLDKKKNNYKIHIRECKKEDIIEIDTYEELKQIDKSYK